MARGRKPVASRRAPATTAADTAQGDAPTVKTVSEDTEDRRTTVDPNLPANQAPTQATKTQVTICSTIHVPNHNSATIPPQDANNTSTL